MSKEFRLVILLIVLMALGVISATVYHENAHKRIFLEYGLENVSIDYGFVSNTTAYGECEGDCKMLNQMNEVIGYNSFGLISMLIVCMFFILILYLEMGEYD